MQTFHFAQVMAVGIGGFFGAMSRFWLSNQMYVWLGRDFVWGTLTVNALGSFLIGLLTILLIDKVHLAIEWRALLIVGFLGAFTTFSTFAFETVMYFQQGAFDKAMINTVGNVVLCLVMVWLGLWVGRQFGLAPV